MKTPREKYENDPQYHNLVNTFVALIDRGQFTPSELREAAIYAATLCEMMKRPRPFFSPVPPGGLAGR